MKLNKQYKYLKFNFDLIIFKFNQNIKTKITKTKIENNFLASNNDS